MSRSKRYWKSKKPIKSKELPPKADLVGEALSERGLEILNRFEKNKNPVLSVYGASSDTPSNLRNEIAEEAPEKQDEAPQNRTSNFLSELAVDSKIKDHKIESDRRLNDELKTVNSRIDKVVNQYPAWAIGTVIVIMLALFGFYWQIDSKIDTKIDGKFAVIKEEVGKWKKAIEDSIEKLKPSPKKP